MEHLVSVCMSTYNHGPFIAQAIEGVMMQQTNFPVELVIGEDSSDDETLQICKDYANKYGHRIKLLPSQKKYGQNENLHRIILACTGKYIALCEGDDCWISTRKLQLQVEFLENHPGHVMCFHKIITVDKKNNPLEETENCNEVIHYEGYDLFHIFIPTLSIVFRNILKDFPNEFFKVKSTDAFLVGMMSEFGNGADLGFMGGYYRKHEGGCYNSLSIFARFKQSVYTRKKMKASAFFNAGQRKEIKKELTKRQLFYCKYFLKKKQVIDFFRMAYVIIVT